MSRSPVMAGEPLRQIHDVLLAAYGPQQWWPADTPTEVAIGAVLTQNTAWTNVERAIASLKAAGCLDFARIAALEVAALGELIRSAGTYRVKARRLQALAAWVRQRGGDPVAALHGETARLRAELLAIHGIGPETADAILLYAGGHATFVIDAYTRRVMRRHGLCDGDVSYDALKRRFENALPRDTGLFNEYHALLVHVGKQHCRARARCEGCPLAHLPHDEVL